ncbi:related to SKT5 protein [Cephalotrichum gorgonifer]|uniref:Related to SKT5 protein n=1 Tax=Cephalotrichum gorgonifer TaxID=2041049 RepID=A0AAE8N5B7_9PEZI|nr:related to SKT5 protein [Cephalotrichum gorgonifer]
MSNYYDSYGRQPQGGAAQPPPPPHNAPPPRGDSLGAGSAQFTATFVPGGFDDYYMPEVLAPAPQRVMPEVPQNMQEDLQRMESGAGAADFPGNTTYNAPPPAATSPAAGTHAAQPAWTAPAASHPAAYSNESSASQPPRSNPAQDAPTFSHFPKVKGENIPRSFEETEDALWKSREHTLHSNDVPLQVEWAKQVLNWVEIAMDEQARELDGKPRPPTPKVEHQLRVDALTIINHLADQEHPDALFMRSKWLEFGKFDHRQDKREAYNGYRRASELGMGRAEYRMGMLFEASNDMRNAIQHYQRGLDVGDSAASYRLGMMSLMGQHGQAKDYHYGLRLIEAAADTADVDAPQGAYVYGLLIARELPDINIPEGLLPFQLPVAKRYIEKAALLGFAKAQLKLGQAYELCQLGCDFNPSFSLHYYSLAAKQGQPEASLGISRWFLFGYEGFFNKNEQLAFKYGKQAADAKLATGEFAMGYYHEIGIHVPKDIREAKRWYEMAADHGNKDAAERLESLNEQKTLTKEDHETTTLTRIKSQHGSMRGKRPDRFTKQASTMPAVSESEAEQPRPRSGNGQGGAAMPDMSRLNVNDNRPPAFGLNVPQAQGNAPYPDDGYPPQPPSNRSQSAAPYPVDDVARPGPHYDHNARLTTQGPRADRPGSAFGIRPLSSGNGGGRMPPPANNLGPGPNDYRRDPYKQDVPRPATAQPYDGRPGGGLPANPAQGRLQKPNPHAQRPVSAMPGGQYPGPQGPRDPAQGAPNYGPRTSSRPGFPPGPGQGPRPVSEIQGRAPSGGVRPDRVESLAANSYPAPAHGGPGRVGTAPPGPQRPNKQPASPAPSAASAPARPPPTQGPATFEEMGIPQGKADGDCVVM